jgi:Zn finger protein HypA/HybF involved in hydrogenase expression
MARKLEVDCMECGRALSPNEFEAEMVVCRKCLLASLEIEETNEDSFPEEYYD